MKVGSILLASGLVLALAQPAIAQVTDSAGRTVYEADFFRTYSPANAEQMIDRLPGFSFDGGSSNVRGFGQAAGNVVINGQRPSAKSDSLRNILERIPASRVLRIVVASGNEFGADYAGKPQVANVILSDEGGLAGTIEARVEREYTGRLLPRGTVSAIYTTGNSTFTGALSHKIFGGNSEEGTDLLSDLATGAELEQRRKVNRNTEPFTTVSLGWAHEVAPDRSAHINGKYSADKWTLHQSAAVSRNGLPLYDSRYDEDHLWHSWELSGDVTRPLAGGALKLNALATSRHRGNEDVLARTPVTGAPDGSYQQFEDWRSERVARLTWSHGDLAGWTFETGLEGAFNRLESDFNLFSVDAQGERTPILLPIDDAVVEEYRAEAFVNGGRSLAQDLRLDLGLTYEASRLTVTGDASARRTLQFLKPKVSLDWSPGDWHAQLSLRRDVAQLDFGDFVSGASINNGQVNGGNAELVPQRSWALLLTADRTLLGDGRLKVELEHERIAQVQDRVPIANGFDAPGNLGDGTSSAARVTLDLPLAPVGVTGGRLSLYGSYVSTSVRDPYTFEDRRFSGNNLFFYNAEFRQDLGEFAWGAQMFGNTGSTYFRRNELDSFQGISPRISAFAEYRPTQRSTITLGIENLADGYSQRWRYFYAPDRTVAEPYQLEYRRRSNHRTIYLQVKHSFG